MRITETKLRSIIRQTLSESPFNVPSRVKEMARDIQIACSEQGVQGCVANPFNSGYIGVSISIPQVGEYIYVDQPGKMSLEDQAGAYIYLGPKGYPIGRNERSLFYITHPAKGYGDINFSDEDYEMAKEQVLNALQNEILDKIGV